MHVPPSLLHSFPALSNLALFNVRTPPTSGGLPGLGRALLRRTMGSVALPAPPPPPPPSELKYLHIHATNAYALTIITEEARLPQLEKLSLFNLHQAGSLDIFPLLRAHRRSLRELSLRSALRITCPAGTPAEDLSFPRLVVVQFGADCTVDERIRIALTPRY